MPEHPLLAPLHAACLCAAWCRTCDGYRAPFEAVVSALRAQHPQLQPHWIDIEDEADLIGDVDIETFPTLLVFDARGVHFAGPLTPQPEVLKRVLVSALQHGGYATPQPQAMEALTGRLRLRWSDPAATATHLQQE